MVLIRNPDTPFIKVIQPTPIMIPKGEIDALRGEY
jgi:hypothetical protein